MSKLELLKEQVKEKFGDKRFNTISLAVKDCNLPSKIELKLWKRIFDCDESINSWLNPNNEK